MAVAFGGYWLIILGGNLFDQVDITVGIEGKVEGTQVIQNDTKAPNVDLKRPILTLYYFWREEVWRANEVLDEGLSRILHLRQPKIRKLNLSIFHHQNIVRFYVAMDYVFFVQSLQSLTNLREYVHDFLLGKIRLMGIFVIVLEL